MRPERRAPVIVQATAPTPIRRFATALHSGDVERIKQVYPGMTDSQRKAWESLFRSAKPESVEIRQVAGVSGPDATPSRTTVVDFTMTVRMSDRTNGTPFTVPATRYRATLKLESGSLVLASLNERR